MKHGTREAFNAHNRKPRTRVCKRCRAWAAREEASRRVQREAEAWREAAELQWGDTAEQRRARRAVLEGAPC